MSIFLLPFLTSLTISIFLTPIIIKFAIKHEFYDKPNSRKIHTKQIPRLGGLAIYIAFIATILLNLNHLDNHLKAIILGSIPIIICGVLDDFIEINYKSKLFFQIIATIILITNNVLIDKISYISVNGIQYIDLNILSIPFTALWVIGVTNAVNLIDGLDGLACGLSAISSAFLFIISIANGDIPTAIILSILSGASLGFLPFNFNPAKIFMGDSGSLFLGFILAGLSIQGSIKYATAIVIIIPLFIIGLPIYDTLATMVRRLIQHKPIMAPDKQHFHHRMLSLGLSHKQVVLLSYGINITLGILALILFFNNNINISFIILIILGLMLFIIIDNLFYSKKQHKKDTNI